MEPGGTEYVMERLQEMRVARDILRRFEYGRIEDLLIGRYDL